MAIAIGGNDNLTGDGEPERIGTIHVSSNLLPMLGAQTAAGRLFGKEDDVPGSAGNALASGVPGAAKKPDRRGLIAPGALTRFRAFLGGDPAEAQDLGL